MADEYEDQRFEHEDDEYDEPIGSCDDCGTNLYEDDCYYHHGLQLCGQCYWGYTH